MSTSVKEASKTFYLFDLDRTLFDTVKAANQMVGLIEQRSDARAQQTVERIRELFESGVSFAMRDVMIEVLGAQATQEIHTQFLEQAVAHELLLPGAQALMDFASTHSVGWGIVTYGSEEAQRVKLQAAKLIDEPFLVTQERDKGLLMQAWQQANGTFLLPHELGGHTIDDLVFVDDHLYSFDSLPNTVSGYWVSPEVSVLDAVEYPASVVRVETISEVITHERARRNIDEA